MNDLDRFHFEPKETPFNVHDHQLILATLLGQEGNIDVELVQGPSGFVTKPMKPNAARLTMKRGPGGTMSPWMCYVHQNFYPWVEQRQFMRSLLLGREEAVLWRSQRTFPVSCHRMMCTC